MSKLLVTAAFALTLPASALFTLAWAGEVEEEAPPIVPQQEGEGAGEEIGTRDIDEVDELPDADEARESESRKGPIDGVEPATREDVSPNVPRAADKVVSPRREAEEEALRDRVETWQDRIERLRDEARARSDAKLGDMVEDVEDEFIVLIHQWRRLQQTADESQWETEMTNFRAALDRFETEWEDKIEEGGEGA